MRHLTRISINSSPKIEATVGLAMKSSMRTTQTANQLPKLPVPPLPATLNRFLRVAKPLVSEAEFQETEKLVNQFASSDLAKKLQSLLEERSKNTENWLSQWWLDCAYLIPRYPLVINVSPGMYFPVQNYVGTAGQIKFASKAIAALLEFKRRIDKHELPLEMAGTAPLDMSQYHFLFGTCRIPGVKRDSLKLGVEQQPLAKHIVVAHRGHFFKLPVYTESGEPLSPTQLASQLERLVLITPTPIAKHQRLGLITAEDRSKWAQLRHQLTENPLSKASLEAIESSLFLVCLDEPMSKGTGVEDSLRAKLSELGSQVLHGGGSDLNSGNRWFDKTIQLIVGFNGGCGLTYEHTPAEGPPVAALVDFTMNYMQKPIDNTTVSENVAPPALLKFELSPDNYKQIDSAAANIDKLAKDVEVQIYPFNHFGKNFPKSQRLSPDSFIQLALQLTYYRMHNSLAPAYETGTLRRFKEGRTDTIRLPTVESAEFVSAMQDRFVSDHKKVDLLRKAIDSHKEYTNAACSGEGMDRHLLALKILASENGLPLPKFLDGIAYKTAVHFKLSTSQVAAKNDVCLLFGPMYSDCYGVCYNPLEAKINFSITAFNSFPGTSALKFSEELERSLLQMQSVLASTVKAKL